MATDLPPATELEGLLRVRRLTRILRVDLGGAVRMRPFGGGGLAVHGAGQPLLSLFDPSLSAPTRIALPEGVDARDYAVGGGRLVVAARDRLVAIGRSAWSLPYPPASDCDRAQCALSSDGAIAWVLLSTGVYLERGDRLLVVDATTGALLVDRELTEALDEGPSWGLGDPHPSEHALFLEGGMGQDDTISLAARLSDGVLDVDAGRRGDVSTCFGAGGRSYATLSHYGDELAWWSWPDRTERSRSSLTPVFDALEDGHRWEARRLGERHLLIPTGEGRLLVWDGAGATELRLDGDERNWDWADVAAGSGWIATARAGDHHLALWSLER